MIKNLPNIIIIGTVFALLIISGCAQQQNTGGKNPDNPNPGPPSTGSASIAVSIQNFAFSPGELSIKAGDMVTWTNNDSAPHTVTSDLGGELKSGTISNVQTYSHKFTQPGTYAYHCGIHTSMKGTIIVQ